jgi:hypothetical protein
VTSAGVREYVYVVVDYIRPVYTKPLGFKSEAADKTFKAMVENKSGKEPEEAGGL